MLSAELDTDAFTVVIGTIYSGYLDEYTNLRTLTVFLEAYSTCEGPWFLLTPFLERGISAEHLHTITIDVRIEYPMDLWSAIDWTALDRVNDELDEAKFEGLRKVVFIMQWREGLEWKPAEGERDLVKQQIEQRLYNLVDAGKLEARVQVVREVVHVHPRWSCARSSCICSSITIQYDTLGRVAPWA